MSFVRDGGFSRGAGAIAARDAVGGARARQARARREVANRARDQIARMMTNPVTRATALGKFSTKDETQYGGGPAGSSDPRDPRTFGSKIAPKRTSVLPGQITRPPRGVSITYKPPPIRPIVIGPPVIVPVIPIPTPGGSIVTTGPSGGVVTTYPTGGGGGGGGGSSGGGGGGVLDPSSIDEAPLTTEPRDASSTLLTSRNLLIAAGVVGVILYLRKKG